MSGPDVLYQGVWPTPDGDMTITIECPHAWLPETRERVAAQLAHQFAHVTPHKAADGTPQWVEIGQTKAHGSDVMTSSWLVDDPEHGEQVRVDERASSASIDEETGEPYLVSMQRLTTCGRSVWRETLAMTAQEMFGEGLGALSLEQWVAVRYVAGGRILTQGNAHYDGPMRLPLETRSVHGD